jgi:hypothetical protein
MSAESTNKPANQSASKKRSFGTISQKTPRFFTFPKSMINRDRTRGLHNFSAVSNERLKARYGNTHTPKGGQRNEKHSGRRTRRHRTRRH